MVFSQTIEETTLEPLDNPENIEEAEPDMGIQMTEGIYLSSWNEEYFLQSNSNIIANRISI